MAQDWASSSPATAQAVHLLRPLTTGEVLDNTFALYRSRFWLFAGLASLSGAWKVLIQGLQLLLRHLTLIHLGQRAAGFEVQANSLVSLLLMLPVTAVVYAAAVYSLGEIYLGRPVTAGQALAATRTKWLRYVGIALWQGWSAMWVAVVLLVPALVITIVLAVKSPGMAILSGFLAIVAVLGGGIYGVIAYIRNSLAVPAAVVENSGVRASMRRSKNLAAGTKGRIFLVLLVAIALYLVAATLESPLLLLIGRHPDEEHIVAQIIVLLVGFVSQTLVSPVVTIGLTLVYFDQRVRNEAFDLQMLLGPEDPVPGLAEPAVEAAYPIESSYIAEPPLEPLAEPPEEPELESLAEPPVEPTEGDGHS